ncbi:MAG: histidine phosphatase family protein [Acidimicrobiales bacterium]
MLYLVRHGQTEANAGGLIQGQSDFDLTDLGRRQAEALAAALPTDAAVIASPLRRALLTAAPIAGERPITVDPRWVEMDFGDLDGKTVAEVRGELWSRWGQDVNWAPGGGESLASVHRRVAEACAELAPRLASEDVIVVTHVSPIKAAIAWALDVSPLIAGRMFVEQASVATVVIGRDDARPVLRSFNDLSATALLEPGTGGRAGSAG